MINVLESKANYSKKQLWASWGEFYKMVNFLVVLQKESDFDTHVKWVG